ncbi:MAG: YicC family protein [Firmicutes bacterium]|nr:YicC family protein [Bacillota bacterium]
MINSMTAFGRAVGTSGGKRYTVEIKSVNGRFLDVSVKYPRQYGFVEPLIKAHISEHGILRGKVDVYLGVDVFEAKGVTVALDGELSESYIKALCELRDKFGLKDDISVMSVASYRDIFVTSAAEEDMNAEWDAIKSVLDEALKSYTEMSAAEGERLADDMKVKLSSIRDDTAKIKETSEENIKGYPERLTERIKSLLDSADVEISEQRILTEAAIFADKASIDEELVRLDSHISAFFDILNGEDAVGRKLDFLVQEMNREINTIGSKSQNTDIAHLVVDVKCTIEKLREQIQNLA